MKPLTKDEWAAVLDVGRKKDVESGETPDFMYSVRSKTDTLTIWTQEGWRDGWFVAKIVPRKYKGKLTLVVTHGAAPAKKQWTRQAIEEHVLEMLSRKDLK